jgi:hypothetical protein
MNRTFVFHIITRLIVGGAQETARLTADMLDKSRWIVHILSGPQTGSEGSLIEQIRDRGIPLTIEPALVRQINPIKDSLALICLTRFIKRGLHHRPHPQQQSRHPGPVGPPTWLTSPSSCTRYTAGATTGDSTPWCAVFTSCWSGPPNVSPPD